MEKEDYQIEKTTYIQSKDNIIDEILKLIEKGYLHITSESEAILFMGKTGSGKSTLVNYIGGAEMFSQKESGDFLIDTKEQIGEIKIGHKEKSETTFPNKYKD